jgi:hypothetical protein
MDRKDYLKSRISESLKGPIEESYKKKYETAPEGVKAVADHMAMLKKQPTDTLKRMANQHYKVHSAKSKNEFIGMLMRAKFGKKKLEAHDSHFQTEQKQGVAEATFTAAASMHAATRKQSGGKTAQPTHGIKVGDAVTTADGKQGRVKFVHGDDIQVTGTNPYYRDRVTNHSAKDLKKSVAEATAWDSDSGTEREVKHFAIVNRKTERRVGTATTAVAAKRAADRHDTKYGANVHSVRPVWAEEYEPVNEASQKLMNYLRDKHGAALQKMSSPELQKAKKAAAAEMKAKTAEKKAAAAEAPKEKVKDTGEHIVVQMRKIADYKPGKYPVRVSPKRSVNVHSDAARKVVASHDQLKKPVEKRKFRISLTQRLRKLKEQLENGRR